MLLASGGIHMFKGLSDPAVWVALAFVIFAVFLYVKNVHISVFDALDGRAGAIRAELAEARDLREQAQAILADYQSKQRNVDAEASGIITLAEREAELLAEETRASLAAMLERKKKSAEAKIAQAELQAVTEVKQAAADVAVGATEKMLRAQSGTPIQAAINASLIEQAIARIDHVKTG